MARYKKHEIRYGDTIQSIAQSETGDLNNWTKIVEYNNLKYPYIVDTPQEKLADIEHLATLGDQLIIPIQADLVEIDVYKLSRRDQDFIMSLALGRDLTMTSQPENFKNSGTSDEIFELTHNGHGDLLTCQGAENIKQATYSRLLTAKGSLMLHPEYGSELHNMFGKTTLEQMKLISIEVCRTVLLDTRIEECVLVDQYIQGDTYVGSYRARVGTLKEQFEFVIQGDNAGSIIIL